MKINCKMNATFYDRKMAPRARLEIRSFLFKLRYAHLHCALRQTRNMESRARIRQTLPIC